MSHEALVYESRIQVPYTWAAGETLSRFLRALRDEKKILATRCAACSRVYVPPRRSCGLCFAELADWLEVGPRGSLLSFTQALAPSRAHPLPRPLYGLIRLEGADTGLLHLLGEADLGELRAGMRVEPVFAEERIGSIMDIRCFRPAKGS
ncbi:MAG: Zn-ribbon domain-containing OB-fold protein [Elusimicrobiota bacterium]